jgi:hypothetical protein
MVAFITYVNERESESVRMQREGKEQSECEIYNVKSERGKWHKLD